MAKSQFLATTNALLTLLIAGVCGLLMIVLFAAGIFMGAKMLEGLDAIGLASPVMYGVGAAVCFYGMFKLQKFIADLRK